MHPKRVTDISRLVPRLILLAALPLMLSGSLGVRPAEADTTDRVRQLLEDNSTDATVGLYLKKVGGPVLAQFNQGFQFEPASTIKALFHFHAMRQVQDGAIIDGDVVTLGRAIPWFMDQTGSCPDLTTQGFDTLANGLTAMMVPSDNRWTQAIRDFFGDANINATRAALNMNSTSVNHLIGCGADAIANPNQLTLVDAGRVYEAVATGFLDETTRTAAYGLMITDATRINAIIYAEAVSLGLSNGAINQFKALRRSAQKAGSYTLSGLEYRSMAGWVSLAFKDANCVIDQEDYVLGVFIHAATALGTDDIRTFGWEMIREEVRAALESWAACEADLEVVSVVLVNPPAEIDVNTPVNVTVRATVRNNGPAAVVHGRLSYSTLAGIDCDVTPASPTQNVLGMNEDASVIVDRVFSIECTEPSIHVFVFSVEIEPLNPNVSDPVPGNNDGDRTLEVAVIARADLAIKSWDFSALDNAVLGDIIVGKTFLFPTVKTLHNFGDTVADLYSNPVEVKVTRSITVPSGVRGSVRIAADEAPATVVIVRPAVPDEVIAGVAAGTTIAQNGPATIRVEFTPLPLAKGVDRVLTEEFNVHCLEPSLHSLSFRNTIEPVDEHVEDPIPANNVLEVARNIECVTPVQINIRPGNSHNFVSIQGNQSLPLAILTTAAGEYGLPVAFDATKVDFQTVRFGTKATLNAGGGSVPAPSKEFTQDAHEMDDKKKDGDLDMVLHFHVPGSGITLATTQACVTGKYLGADNLWHTFFGCDSVTVPPGGGSG